MLQSVYLERLQASGNHESGAVPMSETYYLVCDECRVRVWIGQDSAGHREKFCLFGGNWAVPDGKRLFSPTAKFLLDHERHPLRFLSLNEVFNDAPPTDSGDYVKLNDEDPNLAPEPPAPPEAEMRMLLGHYDYGGHSYITVPGQPERPITEADDLDALVDAGAILRRSEAFDPPRIISEHFEGEPCEICDGVSLMPPAGA
jgi:hypothetical protein